MNATPAAQDSGADRNGPPGRARGLPRHPLCRQFRIDHQEIGTRRDFLNLTALDEKNLQAIHARIDTDVGTLAAEFLSHLSHFPDLKRFLRERAVRDGLRAALREYLLSLGQRPGGGDYIEGRLRVGLLHERLGLEPHWYVGAHAALFEGIGRRLAAAYAAEPGRLAPLLVSLQKVLTFDATLAVETFHRATTQRQEQLLQEMMQARLTLQELARTDELTHVHNRRSVLEMLERERQRSQRFGRPFSLLFLDIDHFKDVNDRHGHAAGDRVLRAMCQAVAGVLRPVDIVGRFGGEEFLVGLVETREPSARRVADRIRRAVARHPFDAGDAPLRVTVSIGVAAMRKAESVEQLIERADRALYRAKESGRNRVV